MSMPEFAMTYVVYWPEEGVLKVGRAWRFHWVQMMARTVVPHAQRLAPGADSGVVVPRECGRKPSPPLRHLRRRRGTF